MDDTLNLLCERAWDALGTGGDVARELADARERLEALEGATQDLEAWRYQLLCAAELLAGERPERGALRVEELAPPPDARPVDRARWLLLRGRAAARRGANGAAATAWLGEALELLGAAGRGRASEAAHAQVALGYLAYGRRAWEEAGGHFARAAELARAQGNAHGESIAEMNLGNVYYCLGDYEECLGAYKRSQELRLVQPSPLHEALTLVNIASVHGYLEEHDTALEFLERSLRLQDEVGASPHRVYTLLVRAEAELKSGRASAARASVELAERALDGDDPVARAMLAASRAELQLDSGEVLAALAGFRAAAAALGDVGAREYAHGASFGAARCLVAAGRADEAVAELRRLLAAEGDKLGDAALATGRRALIDALEAAGDFEGALEEQERLFAMEDAWRSAGTRVRLMRLSARLRAQRSGTEHEEERTALEAVQHLLRREQRRLERHHQAVRRLREAGDRARLQSAQRELTARVVHDLHNLLTVVEGNAELVAHFGRDERVRDAAGRIRGAVDACTSLTSALLAHGRQHPLELAPFDAQALVADLAASLRPLASERGVELCTNGALLERRALGDPVQVTRILTNLATNALEAMPHGGKLTLRAEPAHLQPGARGVGGALPAGPLACLVVEDTGVGIPEAAQEHIFELFVTSKGEGNSGLGLPSVLGLAQQMGGGVRLESRAGEGTRVRVYLRLAD